MTEETPKRPYPNIKRYPESRGNMTIGEAEAGLDNCLAEIKRLRGVLREIADAVGDSSAYWIARTALGENNNGND